MSSVLEKIKDKANVIDGQFIKCGEWSYCNGYQHNPDISLYWIMLKEIKVVKFVSEDLSYIFLSDGRSFMCYVGADTIVEAINNIK